MSSQNSDESREALYDVEKQELTFVDVKPKRKRVTAAPPPDEVAVGLLSQADAQDIRVPRKKSKKTVSKDSDENHAAGDDEKETAKADKKIKQGNRKGEAAVKHFIDSVLPALRKEMAKKKKNVFKLDDHADLFLPNSPIRPAYLLPLFHFLGKNEILCDKFREFDSKAMVHTKDGFNQCMKINKYSTPDVISEHELTEIMKRFGKEWHKIPAKDKVRVAAAIRAGASGEFKIILSGIYYDSFYDDKGEEIKIAVPILNYEGIRAKVVQVELPAMPEKPKKQRKSKKESSSSVENPQDQEQVSDDKPLLDEDCLC